MLSRVKTKFNFAGVALASCLSLMSLESAAAPIFFEDRELFENAAGSLSGFEDFESAFTGPGSMSEPGPWNSNSDDSVFDPGDIADGVSFASSLGNLAVVEGDFLPNATDNTIGPNSFSSDLNISFLPTVNAVGFDVFQIFGAAEGIVVSLFDLNDLLIGATEVPADIFGVFFGVIDDASQIGRITLTANNADSGAEVIDNIAFGQSSATPVPEPASLALFGLGLAGFAMTRRTSRRVWFQNLRTGKN